MLKLRVTSYIDLVRLTNLPPGLCHLASLGMGPACLSNESIAMSITSRFRSTEYLFGSYLGFCEDVNATTFPHLEERARLC